MVPCFEAWHHLSLAAAYAAATTAARSRVVNGVNDCFHGFTFYG